ncbi:MAG TPA: hypothetical protein VM056_01615 [Terriglobales bacterium]|nr:hypothetical protein [Terriglobales bacterium]
MEEIKAKVIDIPLAKWETAEEKESREQQGCKHEKSNGRRCGKEVWQNEMCGMHGDWHNTMSAAMGLNFPDDQLSFHRFLMKTLDMVVTGKIHTRRVVAVEGICKLIYKNIRGGEFEI